MAKLKHPALRELVVERYENLTTNISKYNFLANYKLKDFFANETPFPSEEEQKALQELEQVNQAINEIENEFFFDGTYSAYCSIYDECERVNKSLKSKYKRLKHNIETMLQNECVFATFTFNDETLYNTTSETRRRYVVRALKQTHAYCIGNIDWGKENGREHYHALIQLPKVNRNIWNKSFGNIYLKKVRKTSSATALTKYITKFTKHALKKTTDHNLIYSRCSK